MTGLNLDEQTMKMIIGKSIIEAIPQDKRDLLMANAVANLLAPLKDNYGRNREENIISQIFTEEVRQLAVRETRKMLEENEGIKMEIRKVITAAWEKLTTNPAEYEAFVEKIASAMSRALTHDR